MSHGPKVNPFEHSSNQTKARPAPLYPILPSLLPIPTMIVTPVDQHVKSSEEEAMTDEMLTDDFCKDETRVAAECLELADVR